MSTLRRHLLMLLPMLFSVTPALAVETAINFAPGFTPAESTASFDFADPTTGAYDESASFNLGWEFTVNAPLTVTALGFFTDPSYYDPNNPAYNVPGSSSQPYAQDHPVGVYRNGALLFSATVGQSSPLNGDFRYAVPTLAVGTNSFLLLPGVSYVIAGVTGADDPYLADVVLPGGGSALVLDPAVNYVQDQFTAGASLADVPTQADPTTAPGYFGPDFQFTAVSTVPEPTPLALLGLGLFPIVLLARRRVARE